VTRRIESIRDIQAYVSACRKRGSSVGFVPTMGAFHAGHLSLMRQARRENDAVIVSIFVNPLQFSAGEDYDRYPRRLEQDAKMAESEGVDVLFAPSVAEMYPKGFDSHVDQTDLPSKLCGSFRPGHFRGVM
jgi:pantoate--beta-alanine ligase